MVKVSSVPDSTCRTVGGSGKDGGTVVSVLYSGCAVKVHSTGYLVCDPVS